VAPPGAGKTVVGFALISETGLPTLVLVDRTALLDQWRGQVGTLLGVKPASSAGVVGATADWSTWKERSAGYASLGFPSPGEL